MIDRQKLDDRYNYNYAFLKMAPHEILPPEEDVDQEGDQGSYNLAVTNTIPLHLLPTLQ